MKKQDIFIGKCYSAKVSNRLTTVRVDAIRNTSAGTRYDVTNLTTGRKTTFSSAQKFRAVAKVVATRSTEKTLFPSPPPEKIMRDNGLADSFIKHFSKKSVLPHIMVSALAGVGKTTTLVEGLKRVVGLDSPLTPSPQQAEVWEAMCQSSGHAHTICFAAFNRSIANELASRVPAGCEAMTMHSMGNKAVCGTFGRLQVPKDAAWVVRERIAGIMGVEIDALRKDPKRWEMLESVRKLVSMCKMNLVSPDPSFPDDTLDQLTSHYEIELNGDKAEAYSLVPQVLELCKTPRIDGKMDFDDMIWLPIILDLPLIKYDLLLVDEVQDLSKCQQALAKKAGRRLVLVGDKNQACYGFAGADSDSMPRLQAELSSSPEGCISLPLTVTRRCGKAIVEEAKKIVPAFEAHETNPPGKVNYDGVYPTDAEGKERPRPHYTDSVQDGDMVLCRVNAPLVSQCFRFLKEGHRANIRGRDVGQGLISTIKKLSDNDPGSITVPELVGRLSQWLHSEQSAESAKRNPSDSRLIALQDRYDCLLCFTENQKTVEGVISRIEALFTDKQNSAGISLSSIHKAKGLEARRVFLLQPKGATIPHPMAKSSWQLEQEDHLLYISISRARDEFTYVY